jgi:hypothetical protein
MLSLEAIRKSANGEKPDRLSEVESFFKDVFPNGGMNSNWKVDRRMYEIVVEIPEKYLFHHRDYEPDSDDSDYESSGYDSSGYWSDSDSDSDSDSEDEDEYTEEKKSKSELVAFMEGVEEVFQEHFRCDIGWSTEGFLSQATCGTGWYEIGAYYSKRGLSENIRLNGQLSLLVTIYSPVSE